MKKQAGFPVVELVITLIGLLGVIGWVWNIVKIAGNDFGVITGMLVLRVIGIFIAPLGAVLGYF